MNDIIKLKNSKANGFSIVELLIVIVVIGILAAIPIVSYSGVTSRANTAANQSNANSVQQGAEAAFPVVDLAGLIVAVSQIPPCHFGVRMIGKRGEVFGKNLRGALEVIDAVLLGGARLGGVVEVFAALEEVVGGVRTQRGIDGLGPGNLGDCRAGDENEKCERAFQDAGSVVLFGAFAK